MRPGIHCYCSHRGPSGQAGESRQRKTAAFRRLSEGFTFIEIIALLAIIGIFAAVLLRAVIREIDTRYLRQERAVVKSYSDALLRGILRHGYIPDHTAGNTGWARTVANETGMDEAKVRQNSRGHTRLLLIDPGDIFSVVPLPCTQTALGFVNANVTPPRPVNPPQRARFILASSVGRPLPISAGSMSTNDFANLWNTAPGRVPPGFAWATFPAEDLVLERLDLSEHIHMLSLATDSHIGQYSVGTNLALSVVDDQPRFFLENTVVRLHHSADHPNTNARNSLDSQHVLIRGLSLLYGTHIWQSAGGGGPSYGGLDLESVARQFLTCTRNLNAPPDQQLVIVQSFISFMSNYVIWKQDYNFAPGVMRDYVISRQNVMMANTQRIFLKEGNTVRYPENNLEPCQ